MKLTMLPYIGIPKFFKKDLTYRLHIIRITGADNYATAAIYDGEEVLHTVRDSSREDVVRRAKAWIDEQDEYDARFDLHAAPSRV